MAALGSAGVTAPTRGGAPKQQSGVCLGAAACGANHRDLARRDVWLLATGTDEALPPGFHEPFARTAAYYTMRWQEAFYVRSIKGAAGGDGTGARCPLGDVPAS